MPADAGAGEDAEADAEAVWTTEDDEARRVRVYRQMFAALPVARGGLGKAQALSLLRRSGLGDDELDRVWHDADANGDGVLQMDEFVQALVLAESRRNALAESRRTARPRRRQRW